MPDKLRDSPTEAVDAAHLLTDEEAQGLSRALTSLEAGKGRTLEQVRQTIDGLLRQ